MRTIALIDYGSGNLHSARKALDVAARAQPRPVSILTTSDPDVICRADRIVMPGVGAFGACMAAITARDGVIDAMAEATGKGGRPFLGICVGMQLLATTGEEHGSFRGFGWLPGRVRPLTPRGNERLPHMGWNALRGNGHPLLPSDGYAYFVHSYAMTPENPDAVIATADHGGPFVAAVAKGNIAGVQFHPEKSQGWGLSLLDRFLRWEP